MKILLVNPYIYDFTAYDLWLRPLGLLYIAAVLKKYTHCQLYWLDTLDRFQESAFSENDPAKKRSKSIGIGKYHREIVEKPEIFENTPRTYARYGIPLKTFLDKINKIPPVDLILVTSLMTYWIDGVKITINILRDKFPQAKILLGGILPSLLNKNYLSQLINVDYIVEGYGEKKILEFISAHKGKVKSSPNLLDINNLPFPAVEFLNSQKYLPLLTSRGCPLNCTYCASGILNKKFSERNPEAIINEIEYMHDTFGTQHFIIFDDALLIHKRQRFLKIFQKMSKNLKVSFHTPNGLHTREIDQETAETLFNINFKTLRLSFESTTSDILSRSANKVTIQQMVQAIENLEKAGYKRKDLDVYLLFGIPGQKIPHLEEALHFVKALGVKPHLSYYSPVPGTVDFQNLQKKGILSSPINLYETNKIYFIYNKSGFSLEEIKYIKNKTAILQYPQ